MHIIELTDMTSNQRFYLNIACIMTFGESTFIPNEEREKAWKADRNGDEDYEPKVKPCTRIQTRIISERGTLVIFHVKETPETIKSLIVGIQEKG